MRAVRVYIAASVKKGNPREKPLAGSGTSGFDRHVRMATRACLPRDVGGEHRAARSSARHLDRPNLSWPPERWRRFLDAGQRGARDSGGNVAGGKDSPEMGRQLGGPHDERPVPGWDLGRLPRRMERENLPRYVAKDLADGSLRLVAKRPRPGLLVAERLAATRVRTRPHESRTLPEEDSVKSAIARLAMPSSATGPLRIFRRLPGWPLG